MHDQRITVRCSLRLWGTLVCAAQQLKRYYDPEDLYREEWELNDEEIAALDVQVAASPMEVEAELPDMNGEGMAKELFFMVKSILPTPLLPRVAVSPPLGTVWSGESYLGTVFCLCAP